MLDATAKKWRLLRQWTARYPMWCAWQVTYRCNFRCEFCGYWKDPRGAEPEPSADEIGQACRKLDKLGTILISLAGGEPLLREDIVEIVRKVAQFHIPFITTNGWLLTPELARRLFEAGLWGVSVSIDYADPAMHDKRRGVEGAFDRAVRALDYLAAARVHRWQRVNVMTVLLHDNLDHIEPLLQLAARHGVYLMVQPYGMLKTGHDLFRCRQEGVSQRLLNLRQRYRNFLSNPHFLNRFDEALNGGVTGCRAGSAFFSIDSLGEVSSCVEPCATSVGNIYQDDGQVLMRRLRQQARGNNCRQCWYNCRGEVEMLYHPLGLARSLPTLLFDRGRARC